MTHEDPKQQQGVGSGDDPVLIERVDRHRRNEASYRFHSQAELEDYAGQMDKGLALVRDEVRKALDSAALELDFGRALERLVGPVVEDRARLATESQAVIEEVKKLGTFLGEKPEVPPEDIFRGVWRFAQQWDRSMKKFAPPSGKRPRSA